LRAKCSPLTSLVADGDKIGAMRDPEWFNTNVRARENRADFLRTTGLRHRYDRRAA